MTAPTPSPFELGWPPLLEAIRAALGEDASATYLVGGAVRDALLRRPLHDLDFAVAGDGRPIARRIADKFGGSYYPLDADRGVGRAIVGAGGEQFVVDVAAFRGESLDADLSGRDFTINALAVPLEGDLQTVIDPLGGLDDLQQKRLRRCSPLALESDPVRALRAVRQSVALGLHIEPETRLDIRRFGPQIVSASPERIRDEFMNMLGGPRPHVSLRILDALGLLTLIVPEVEAMRGVLQSPPHCYDVWEHTLNVVERLYGVMTTVGPTRTDESAADSAYGMIVYLLDRFRHPLQTHLNENLANNRSVTSLLVLAALLHDCAKPLTRSVDAQGRIHYYQHEVKGAELAHQRATALRLSSDEAARLSAIVRHHMRTMQLQGTVEVSRRTIHRFWKATGAVGVDVCLLTLSDYLGMVGVNLVVQDWIGYLQVVGALLDGYFNQHESLVIPPALVSGHDLITLLALRPGPDIGHLLSAISEAQATGEVTTAAEALSLAKLILDASTDSPLSEN